MVVGYVTAYISSAVVVLEILLPEFIRVINIGSHRQIFNYLFGYLTIYCLDSSDIINVQSKIGLVTSVVCCHKSTAVLRMPQAKSMPDLMSRNNTQIGTIYFPSVQNSSSSK